MRPRRDGLANFRIRTHAASFVLLAGLASTADAADVGETCGGIANISCDASL